MQKYIDTLRLFDLSEVVIGKLVDLNISDLQIHLEGHESNFGFGYSIDMGGHVYKEKDKWFPEDDQLLYWNIGVCSGMTSVFIDDYTTKIKGTTETSYLEAIALIKSHGERKFYHCTHKLILSEVAILYLYRFHLEAFESTLTSMLRSIDPLCSVRCNITEDQKCFDSHLEVFVQTIPEYIEDINKVGTQLDMKANEWIQGYFK